MAQNIYRCMGIFRYLLYYSFLLWGTQALNISNSSSVATTKDISNDLEIMKEHIMIMKIVLPIRNNRTKIEGVKSFAKTMTLKNSITSNKESSISIISQPSIEANHMTDFNKSNISQPILSMTSDFSRTKSNPISFAYDSFSEKPMWNVNLENDSIVPSRSVSAELTNVPTTDHNDFITASSSLNMMYLSTTATFTEYVAFTTTVYPVKEVVSTTLTETLIMSTTKTVTYETTNYIQLEKSTQGPASIIDHTISTSLPSHLHSGSPEKLKLLFSILRTFVGRINNIEREKEIQSPYTTTVYASELPTYTSVSSSSKKYRYYTTKTRTSSSSSTFGASTSEPSTSIIQYRAKVMYKNTLNKNEKNLAQVSTYTNTQATNPTFGVPVESSIKAGSGETTPKMNDFRYSKSNSMSSNLEKSIQSQKNHDKISVNDGSTYLESDYVRLELFADSNKDDNAYSHSNMKRDYVTDKFYNQPPEKTKLTKRKVSLKRYGGKRERRRISGSGSKKGNAQSSAAISSIISNFEHSRKHSSFENNTYRMQHSASDSSHSEPFSSKTFQNVASKSNYGISSYIAAVAFIVVGIAWL